MDFQTNYLAFFSQAKKERKNDRKEILKKQTKASLIHVEEFRV
jgi:hypothetical protein